MTSIVRHKVFGRRDRPTIYYLTGYGSTIKIMQPHIKLLTHAGFRVVAFEYDKAILNAGQPLLMNQSIDNIESTITADKATRSVAGIYGISLGTFLGANILAHTNIRRGMFNTGLVSLVDTVWHNDYLAKEKQKFIKKGESYESLKKAWADIDVGALSKSVKGKQIILMASTGDTILRYKDSLQTVSGWRAGGASIKLIKGRILNHGRAIFRNLFRLITTMRFFRQPVL